MKVYQTDSGLGYNQLAFLIRVDKSENGFNYLCIGKKGNNGPWIYYEVGELIKDLEDIYIQESTFKIEDSDLFGSYLFDFWLKNNTHTCNTL